MKYLKAFDLTFSDTKMEAEYTGIKNQYILRDFLVTIVVLFLVTVVVAIERVIRSDYSEFIISATTCAVLLFILVMGRYIRRKYLKYLTIFAIFCYNVYRVILTEAVYATIVKANMFFGGYTYAILHMIMISRVPGNYAKFFVVTGMYIFRFGLFIGWMDIRALQAGSLIRGVIVDVFILYYFYINEKTERGVFQNYHDNRDELKKFQELLDDSLPISVTVVGCKKGEFLFSNKAFSGTFERDDNSLDPPHVTDPSLVPMIPLNGNTQATQTIKPHISFLKVDQTTLREMGSVPQTIGSSEFSSGGTVYLKEIMDSLIKSDSINDRVLCFSASYANFNQRKSYDIILKRIKWNKVDAVAIIISDITDHENFLALKMANLNKDKIIATVSHELRTPLGAIFGLIGMAEQHVTHPQALEYLSLSKDTAELLLALVNSHLDLQQINAGKLRLNPSKLDVGKAMNDITRLFQFQTSKKGIYLELLIGKDVPKTIVTDENRLKQILINLIGNAIKFTFNGGITIEICKDAEVPKCLQITVVDTGIGIKDSDKENLFQMYTRLEEGRKINKNGVGLGLMISNALAALLSGKTDGRGIEVASQQGVGSRFYFRILEDLGSIIDTTSKKNKEARSKEKFGIMNDKKREDENKEDNKDQDKESTQKDLSEESLTPVDSRIAQYISRVNTHDQKQNFRKSFFGDESCFDTRGTDNAGKSTKNFLMSKKDLKEGIVMEDIKLSSIANTTPHHRNHHNNSPKDRILVVDDNPFNVLVAENLLKDMGYLVKSALGGKEAIEIVKSFNNEGKNFKFILMDCLMPEIDGYETSIILKGLMDKGEISPVPIIALTANSNNEEEVKKCVDSGMEGYITKPVTTESLLKALSKYE